MKKLHYKYSLKWDLIWAYRTLKNIKWLQDKKLVFFRPNISRMIKLWFKRPIGPEIEVDFDVTCYWISSGTWGSYTPPDKIFICSTNLKNLERVIQHEISHLRHDNEVKGMSHEQKEDYINRQLINK